jgi:hypothetical protein
MACHSTPKRGTAGVNLGCSRDYGDVIQTRSFLPYPLRATQARWLLTDTTSPVM